MWFAINCGVFSVPRVGLLPKTTAPVTELVENGRSVQSVTSGPGPLYLCSLDHSEIQRRPSSGVERRTLPFVERLVMSPSKGKRDRQG